MATNTETFTITGMHCQSCAGLIADALQSVPGVKQATADFKQKQTTITFEADKKPKLQLLQKAAEEAGGYGIQEQSAHHHIPASHHDHKKMDHQGGHSSMSSTNMAKEFLHRFYIVSVLVVPLAILSMPGVSLLGYQDFTLRPWIELSLASVIFYYGLVFFEHAIHEIKSKQYGMMTLVSLGVGSGYLFSVVATFIPSLEVEFYLEISTLIWILLFGHFLEARSSSAAGNALQEVAKLLPKLAHRKTTHGIEEVSLEELQSGDIVIVKAGEKVPADGVIVSGSANFNESHVTGESKPVEKDVASHVVAGAINIDGSVEIKLERVGESSTIGQIKKLISQAQQTKPSAQKLADRASKWLTVAAIISSILALLIWSVFVGEPFVFAITMAITVLVIACPHALGLAIPTVSTIATKLAVNNGIFIKDMGKIEIVKNINYVVFDKTGTLTKGEFGITNIAVFSGTEKSLLQITGAIEQQSSHVIGMAIMEYLKQHSVKPLKAVKVKNIAGRGMQANVNDQQYFVGNQRLMEEKDLWTQQATKKMQELSDLAQTPVFVANEKEIIGILGLSDEIKPEAAQAVAQLHQLGIKVAMLTGDTKAAAEPIAKQLQIDTVFAEVLPEDKYIHIKQLQQKGSVVLMAGDGVNDAPALTQANIGVAVGAGTDVALEAGDIVLTQSNPQHIVRLIVLAQKTYSKMVQNLWWALGYNIIAIPAAAGLFMPWGFRLSPAVGALMMSLSSVIVVINAMALRRVNLKI